MPYTPDDYEDHEAIDAEENAAYYGGTVQQDTFASDDAHGGCYQPHRSWNGDYMDCDGRPL